MNHVRRLGNQISVPMPRDADGLLGRECPAPKCESYFKIQPGTGLPGKDLPCHCPYCGHTAAPNQFFTKAQIEYAKSVALNQLTGALLKDMKSLEFNHPPRGGFGIGISMTVTGQPTPIRYYREQKLETEVVCDQCTLRYMIYGVFGYCPDCRVHNSRQILTKNLELVEKLLGVAETQEFALAIALVENALEDCVSAFDGFGRETCRVFASKATKPEIAAEIRFQNVASARDRVRAQFGVDFSVGVTPAEWGHVLKAFQKRHLLAHKMGVVDEDYLSVTGDSRAVLGRKISINAPEVRELVAHLKVLGSELFRLLEAK
jgi:hypothetical protein